VLADVEALNQKALKGEHDITKLSFHAYAYVLDKYILLRAGSALGFNCGPLLVRSSELGDRRWEALLQTPNTQHPTLKIAIPGKMTTANFLLSLAYPNLQNKVEYVFSEIENAVLKGEVDAGLIIHENRFTYQDKGLEKIMDLGEYWNSLIQAPIPLGGIVIRREFDKVLQQKVNRLIRKSVEYAFANPQSSMPYVREHAQEMSEEVMKKHIDLYVNRFSVDLGEEGIGAVELMFNKTKETGLFSFKETKLVIE
jgi:1,4-dihydroxy-6-naphthoate synthase